MRARAPPHIPTICFPITPRHYPAKYNCGSQCRASVVGGSLAGKDSCVPCTADVPLQLHALLAA